MKRGETPHTWAGGRLERHKATAARLGVRFSPYPQTLKQQSLWTSYLQLKLSSGWPQCSLWAGPFTNWSKGMSSFDYIVIGVALGVLSIWRMYTGAEVRNDKNEDGEDYKDNFWDL